MAYVTLKAFNYYPTSDPATTTFIYVYTGHAAYPHMWIVDRSRYTSYDEDDIGDEACAAAKCVTRFFFTESNDITSSVKTLSSEMKETLEAYNAVHPSPNNISFDARLIYYTLFKSLGYPVFNDDNTWYVPLKDYTPNYASSILKPIYVTNLSKAEILEKIQGATTNSKLVVYTGLNYYGTIMPLFERTYQEVTSYYMLYHVDNFEYYFDPAYDDDSNIDSWPLNLTTKEYNTLKNYAAISGQPIDFDNWSNYLDKENANDNGDYLLVHVNANSLNITTSGRRITNEYSNTWFSNNLLPKSNTYKLGSSYPVKTQSIQVKILYNTQPLISPSSSVRYFDILHKLVYSSGANAHPYTTTAYWARYQNNMGTYTHILEFNYGYTTTINNASYTTTVLRTYNSHASQDNTYDTTVISEGNMVIAMPMCYYDETGEYDGYSLNAEEAQRITDAYNNQDGDLAPFAVFDTSDTSAASNHSTTVLYCTIIPNATPPALSSRSLYWYSSNIGARYNQFLLGYGNDCVSDDYPNTLTKFYNGRSNSLAATTDISSDGVNMPSEISTFTLPGTSALDGGFCKIIFTTDTDEAPIKLLIGFS